MKPVKYFNTVEAELRWLRDNIMTTYKDSTTQPEHYADAKCILQGIGERFEKYYKELILLQPYT